MILRFIFSLILDICSLIYLILYYVTSPIKRWNFKYKPIYKLIGYIHKGQLIYIKYKDKKGDYNIYWPLRIMEVLHIQPFRLRAKEYLDNSVYSNY